MKQKGTATENSKKKKQSKKTLKKIHLDLMTN